IATRVRSSNVVGRGAAWLADRDNAAAVAGHAADAVVGLADILRDEDVHRLLEEEIGRGLERIPVAPLAGRALRQLTAEGRHQERRVWSSSPWAELKATLRAQAADPEGEMRRRLADAVVAAGVRLQEDSALTEKAEQLTESAARYLAERFHDEIASLVSGTIARWDAEETSRKLELLLGRDLQFIRI